VGLIAILVTDSEKKDFEERASRRRLTLSDWRRALRKICRIWFVNIEYGRSPLSPPM